MGKTVTFDYSKVADFVSAEELANFKSTVMGAKETLISKSGAGNDFVGWIDLPVDTIRKSLNESKQQQRRFRAIQTYFWL